MWLYWVGQKVACINPRWGDTITGGEFQRRYCPNLPIQDAVYHIRTLEMGKDEPMIRLVEIINPENNAHGRGPFEPVFQSSRFRPLETIKTTAEKKALEPV